MFFRLGDARDHVRRLCGDEVYNKCKPIWGLNKEGEINGVWRHMGVHGLWYMMGLRINYSFYNMALTFETGNFALCRFHSTHVALRMSFYSTWQKKQTKSTGIRNQSDGRRYLWRKV